MKDLRERCENLVTKARTEAGYGEMPKLEFELKHAIESFARQIRNEALEEVIELHIKLVAISVSDLRALKTDALAAADKED